MANIMRAVKVLVICFVFMSTCYAVQDLRTDLQKETLKKADFFSEDESSPPGFKFKRDERSHPNNMNQVKSKITSKARPLNLRLDSVPRQRQTPVHSVVPKTVSKVPVQVPVRILPIHQEKAEAKPMNINLKSNGITKEHQNKPEQNHIQEVKQALQNFFEDSDELVHTIVHGSAENEKKDRTNTNVRKMHQKPMEYELEKNDDNDIIEDNIQIHEKGTKHVEVNPKLIIHKNLTKEMPKTLENKLTNNKTNYVENSSNNSISRKGNYSNTGEISLTGNAVTDTTREDEIKNKISMEQPCKDVDRTTFEPNNTSIVISNHDYEEFSERSNGYATDTINIKNQDPININPAWNYLPYYPYFQPYGKSSYSNNDAGSFNYQAPYSYSNSDDYGMSNADSSNYQVIDFKPDSTDRVYRTWKNTEIKISKGSHGNPININVEHKFDDVGDRDVIKTPYWYGSQPVMWNGYYGNQNIAKCPYSLRPSYHQNIH